MSLSAPLFTFKTSKFTNAQIAKLRTEWNSIERIDPSNPTYKQFRELIDRLPVLILDQLISAKIRFISALALNTKNARASK